MKRLGGLTFGLALAVVAFGQAPAVAGPFGSTAEIRDLATLPLVDVQARRVRPAGPRPAGPRYRGRGGNGAAAAGALIGAAIIGGAIIAESQRRERYVDDGYYYDDAPTGYAVPSPYYSAPGYYAPAPRRYYGGADYPQRQYYRRGPAPESQIIYTPDKEMPYQYAPAQPYGGGYYAPPAGGKVYPYGGPSYQRPGRYHGSSSPMRENAGK